MASAVIDAQTVPLRTTVEESSQVSPARSLAKQVAYDVGLTALQIDQVAIVATELAENLHRHASGGELIVVPGAATSMGATGLRILAVDRGPGVARFDRCLVDGFTTAGTMGTGLGAAQRLATSFDAASEPGRGTVVCAGFSLPGTPTSPFDVGALGFPIAGEEVNGDSWIAREHGGRLTIVLADGLGHGPVAAIASREAIAALAEAVGRPAGEILGAINHRLDRTRGAAVTVATLTYDDAHGGGEVVTAGLGNVSLLVTGRDGASKRVATAHGTAGARLNARITEDRTAFPPGGVLVLHSDGLLTRWSLEGRVELLRHSCEVIAAVLWRDHVRGTDDTQIVVAKTAGPAS